MRCVAALLAGTILLDWQRFKSNTATLQHDMLDHDDAYA
jgi:hypothetical protein